MNLDSPLIRGLIVAIILAAIGAAVFFARDRGSGSDDKTLFPPPTPAVSTTPEAGTGALDSRAPIIGQPAPDFALRDVDGQLVRLSDLRGKVVLVNFWATWCRPCKKELPIIQKIADEHTGDLVVLAVNYQEPASVARSYFEDHGLSLPLLLDRGAVYDQYKLQGLPDSFFIDREGNLAALQYGELSESKARERLSQAGLD